MRLWSELRCVLLLQFLFCLSHLLHHHPQVKKTTQVTGKHLNMEALDYMWEIVINTPSACNERHFIFTYLVTWACKDLQQLHVNWPVQTHARHCRCFLSPWVKLVKVQFCYCTLFTDEFVLFYVYAWSLKLLPSSLTARWLSWKEQSTELHRQRMSTTILKFHSNAELKQTKYLNVIGTYEPEPQQGSKLT